MHAQKQNTQKPNKTVCAQRLTHTFSHVRTHTHSRSYRTHSSRTKRERIRGTFSLISLSYNGQQSRRTQIVTAQGNEWNSPQPQNTKFKQSAVTGRCLHKLAHSLVCSLSHCVLSHALRCCPAVFAAAAAAPNVHPLATRCICCSLYLQLSPPSYTLFLPKIPFIIDYWFSFSPSRCAPSLSPSDSVYVYPTTDHWQLHGTVNVATLARETASPHRCWLWRLRAVQLGGFKPALIRCKLQSMRK